MQTSKYKRLFEEIYTHHYHKVRYFAYHYLYDDEEATDVAQEVFVALWESLDKVDLERDIVPFLMTLARNKCMNILKHREVMRKYENLSTKAELDSLNNATLNDLTASCLYSTEVEKLFARSLEEMPQKTKEIFLLNKVQGLKYKEIADKEGISLKLVEYRMMSAFRILRKKLKDYFEVISVSTDKDEAAWRKALAEEKLLWPNFRDGAVANLYKVRSIPALFLMDADGKLVAENLRGEELAKKLDELMR